MAINTYSETQQDSSYSFIFEAESTLYTPALSYPDSYLVYTIYRNEIEYYVSPHSEQGTPLTPYTFNEVSTNDIEYTVVYRVYSDTTSSALVDESSIIPITILEYQPTFDLPVVTCAELNKPFTFYPTNWFQNNNGLCPDTPINGGVYEIEYKRYEFNINTSSYDLKDTELLTIDANDIDDENNDGQILDPEAYAYQGGAWVPDKLAMVKFVVTINNCSVAVEKATVFPICGSWKIRRLSCGNYRIYNYKSDVITYSLYDNASINPNQAIKTETIGSFSYVELPLTADGVYKVQADGITQFIFNFCELENCILELQKQILLDECFCDSCKRNKDLYQKAMRMLPLYETWKKLLDKDGVYDMQYKTTDIAGELARIYDAQELYLELSKLCENCGDIQKKCGC